MKLNITVLSLMPLDDKSNLSQNIVPVGLSSRQLWVPDIGLARRSFLRSRWTLIMSARMSSLVTAKSRFLEAPTMFPRFTVNFRFVCLIFVGT